MSKLLLVPLLLALAASPVQAQEGPPAFSQAELDQMLAPIALYPDALLAQILMASTYPLEVVEAARWSRANPGLEGAGAVEAVADQPWDPSVKALVAFPQVLARLDEDLVWMSRLGDAFLLQEEQVMAAVQGLRERAHAAGHLDRLEHVRVHRDETVIVIEPAHPQVVYVPYYHPTVVYGGWWWPAYPPVYWAPPPGYYSRLGFYWYPGIRVSSFFFFTTFHWHHRHVVLLPRHHHKPVYRLGIKHPRFVDAQRWQHNPKHRRGVAYHHPKLQQRYGGHEHSRRDATRSVGVQSVQSQRSWDRDRRDWRPREGGGLRTGDGHRRWDERRDTGERSRSASRGDGERPSTITRLSGTGGDTLDRRTLSGESTRLGTRSTNDTERRRSSTSWEAARAQRRESDGRTPADRERRSAAVNAFAPTADSARTQARSAELDRVTRQLRDGTRRVEADRSRPATLESRRNTSNIGSLRDIQRRPADSTRATGQRPQANAPGPRERATTTTRDSRRSTTDIGASRDLQRRTPATAGSLQRQVPPRAAESSRTVTQPRQVTGGARPERSRPAADTRRSSVGSVNAATRSVAPSNSGASRNDRPARISGYGGGDGRQGFNRGASANPSARGAEGGPRGFSR